MNVSDAVIQELYLKGKNYLRVLAVGWEEVDECLSRAFMKLLEVVENHPEDKHTEIAYNFWKRAVYQAAIDDFRQRKSSKVPVNFDVEEDVALVYEENEKEFKVIHAVFEHLTDDDIIILLALVDNNLSVAEAAKYLNQQRTNLYHILRRIRERLRTAVPEFFEVKLSRGTPQSYLPKNSEWNRFLMAVEVVDYAGWCPSLYDPSEVLVYETDVRPALPFRFITGAKRGVRNRVSYGTVATTTPTIRNMTLEEFERGM